MIPSKSVQRAILSCILYLSLPVRKSLLIEHSCLVSRLAFPGGYRFSPNTSLADALSIFVRGYFHTDALLTTVTQDLETMLHSGERPLRKDEPAVKLVTSNHMLWSYRDSTRHPIDLITADKFPPRAQHPLLQQPVKSAANSVEMAGSGGDDRTKRIMREVSRNHADRGALAHHFLSEDQSGLYRPASPY